MITHSIKTNHCWSCNSELSLHQHHVVPREYGGSRGPTVTLCATCHNFIHAISTKVWVSKDTSYLNKIQSLGSNFNKTKLSYMISVIIKARQATEGDTVIGAKAVSLALHLNPEQRRRFSLLKKTLQLSNRELLIKAIDDLYKKTFTFVKH